MSLRFKKTLHKHSVEYNCAFQRFLRFHIRSIFDAYSENSTAHENTVQSMLMFVRTLFRSWIRDGKFIYFCVFFVPFPTFVYFTSKFQPLKISLATWKVISSKKKNLHTETNLIRKVSYRKNELFDLLSDVSLISTFLPLIDFGTRKVDDCSFCSVIASESSHILLFVVNTSK